MGYFYKLFLIIILFYLFALLQNSFFVNFSFFGNNLNLVFILFFLLIFFEKNNFHSILFAIIAGLLLDLSLYNYLGLSVVFLLIILFLLRRTQLLLNNSDENYHLIFFLSLFFVYFVVFQTLNIFYLWFIGLNDNLLFFDFKFFVGIIYNMFFATLGLLIFKKIIHVKKV